jgi:ribosomal protein L16 Arg81 hydroxylase
MLTFEDLLQPVALQEFVGQIWDKSTLHIPGAPAKLAGLPGLPEFGHFFTGNLSSDYWESPVVGASVQASLTDSLGKVRRVRIAQSQASQFYNIGASLCFPPVDAAHPALQAFVADVVKHTGFPGRVFTTAYLTPPHSGSEMHFDSQHVFFCQVSGEKHWKISTEPGAMWPPIDLAESGVDGALVEGARELGWSLRPPSECHFTELVLKHGDVLYLPPGTWHQPHTGESHSFHYTLSLASISSWRILYPLIQMAMMHHPEWRRDLRFLEKAATADDSEEAVVGRVLKQFREMLAKTNPREVLDLYRGIELLPEAIRELLRANH